MGNRTCRCEHHRRQESQLGGLDLLLGDVYVQCSVEQVGVVIERLLDKNLQLRISEDTAPRQVAEVVGALQRRLVVNRVTHNAVHLHVRTLVSAIEAPAACQGQGRKNNDVYVRFHHDHTFLIIPQQHNR